MITAVIPSEARDLQLYFARWLREAGSRRPRPMSILPRRTLGSIAFGSRPATPGLAPPSARCPTPGLTGAALRSNDAASSDFSRIMTRGRRSHSGVEATARRRAGSRHGRLASSECRGVHAYPSASRSRSATWAARAILGRVASAVPHADASPRCVHSRERQ